jgi:acyl carrier protein
MENTIDQQVIQFTSEYVHMPIQDINDSTVLANIGISSEEDMINYMRELEENFSLTYQDGDQLGIVTVGDASKFIQTKLGQQGETRSS